MTIDELKAEIKRLSNDISLAQHCLGTLEEDLAKQLSQQFIQVNKITRADVQMSTGDEVLWWSSILKFAAWLRSSNCTKRFAEWRRRLYVTSELLAGNYEPTPGRVWELPE